MRLFGIIGKSLGSSPSPKIYNAFFKKHRLDCRYLPFQVEKRHLKNLVLCMKLCDVYGLNVTVPYKEAVIPFLDGLDKSAGICGAVNTIVRRKNRFIGYNTDGAGFLKALKGLKRFDPKGKKILILGAGGAARGIAAALAKAGAKEIVFRNRHSLKAKKTAAFFRKKFSKTKWGFSSALLSADLIVQATPVSFRLPKKIPSFDIRTNRLEGLKMLKNQAALNLKLWVGRN